MRETSSLVREPAPTQIPICWVVSWIFAVKTARAPMGTLTSTTEPVASPSMVVRSTSRMTSTWEASRRTTRAAPTVSKCSPELCISKTTSTPATMGPAMATKLTSLKSPGVRSVSVRVLRPLPREATRSTLMPTRVRRESIPTTSLIGQVARFVGWSP